MHRRHRLNNQHRTDLCHFRSVAFSIVRTFQNVFETGQSSKTDALVSLCHTYQMNVNSLWVLRSVRNFLMFDQIQSPAPIRCVANRTKSTAHKTFWRNLPYIKKAHWISYHRAGKQTHPPSRYVRKRKRMTWVVKVIFTVSFTINIYSRPTATHSYRCTDGCLCFD